MGPTSGSWILGGDDRGRVVLERRDAVFVLRMDRGENRFDALLVDALSRALDRVEAATGAAALVCTGGGRFFSNGYDMEALSALSRDGRREFIRGYQSLLARWLRLPRPTFAAIDGHAVGAGALLALASDWRFMRRDRGVFWLPEVDAGIPFRSGMRALLRHRLAPPALRDAVLAGRRFGGEEALAAGIVHGVAAEDALLARTVERAAALAHKRPEAFGPLRAALLSEVADALDPALPPDRVDALPPGGS